MRNKDQLTKIEPEPGSFPRGHARSCPSLSVIIWRTCGPFLLAILMLCLSACSVVRPLHGGKDVTRITPSSIVTQALVQGENPSSASRQSQETIRTRMYTLTPRTKKITADYTSYTHLHLLTGNYTLRNFAPNCNFPPPLTDYRPLSES